MSNLSNGTDLEEWRQMPLWAALLLWLTTIVFSLATIGGNLLVLIAFGIDKNLRVTSNSLIASLAVSDLIIGIEGFPVLTHYVVSSERWFIGAFACKLWISVDYTLCLVSILTVLLITIDRFLSVCYTAPYRNWQTDRKMLIFIIFSWIVPFLFFIGMIYGFYHNSAAFASYVCYPPFLDNPYLNMSMYLVYYWATLAAMVVLYRGIHRVASEVQERAEAKEKQAIAMAALQRCMAQMGVSMLLAATHVESSNPSPSTARRNPSHDNTNTVPDSGYSTTTAVLAYQPAPIVIESQVIPSIVSESDSAYDPVSYEPIEEFESIEERSLGMSTPVLAAAPTAASSCSSSSYASFASQINCEGMSNSLLDEDLFCPRGWAVISPVEDSSTQTFRTASSGETFITAEEKAESSSHTSSFSSAVSSFKSCTPSVPDHDRTLTVNPKPLPKLFVNSPRKQSLTPQSSWPCNKVSPSKTQALRNSLRYQPTTIYLPIKEEQPLDTSECMPPPTKITVEPASSSPNVEDVPDHLPKSDSSTTTFSSFDNTGRKQNVVIATIRRFSKSPNAVDRVDQGWAQSSSRSADSNKDPQSSASEKTVRISNSVRSDFLEKDTVTTSIIAKAATAFQGGQEFFSNIFSTSWLLGRKRKKTKAERRARKAFRTITIILGAFVLFWSPYYIIATIFAFCRPCIPQWLYITSYYMCYLNSTVNPFCYAMANRQFKIAFEKILHFDCTKSRSRAQSLKFTGNVSKTRSHGLPGAFKALS